MESYFSPPNNTKYLISSKTLINPFILLNLTGKGLVPIKILYEILQNKIFLHDFSSIKTLSRSKLSKLVIRIVIRIVIRRISNINFF